MINVNVSQPNDGLGDKLRDAFIIVNDNFNELFSLIGDAVNQTELDSAIDSINTQLNTIVTDINSDLTNILNILDTKSDIGHTHLISEISGLQTILNSFVTSTIFNTQISSISSQIASINDILLDLQNQINDVSINITDLQAVDTSLQSQIDLLNLTDVTLQNEINDLQNQIDNIPPNDLQSVTDAGNNTTTQIIGDGGISGSTDYANYNLMVPYYNDMKWFRFTTVGDGTDFTPNQGCNFVMNPEEGINIQRFDYDNNLSANISFGNDTVYLYANSNTGNGNIIVSPTEVSLKANGVYDAYLRTTDLTTQRSFEFPDNDGTLALLSDVGGGTIQEMQDNNTLTATWSFGSMNLGGDYYSEMKEFRFETSGDDIEFTSDRKAGIRVNPEEGTYIISERENGDYIGTVNVDANGEAVIRARAINADRDTSYFFTPEYITINSNVISGGSGQTNIYMDASTSRTLYLPYNSGVMALVTDITMQQASNNNNLINIISGNAIEVINQLGDWRSYWGAAPGNTLRFRIEKLGVARTEIGNTAFTATNLSTGSQASLVNDGTLLLDNTSGKRATIKQSASQSSTPIIIDLPITSGTLALAGDVVTTIASATASIFNNIVKQTVTNGVTSSCPSQDAVYDFVTAAIASVTASIPTSTPSLSQVTAVGNTSSKIRIGSNSNRIDLDGVDNYFESRFNNGSVSSNTYQDNNEFNVSVNTNTYTKISGFNIDEDGFGLSSNIGSDYSYIQSYDANRLDLSSKRIDITTPAGGSNGTVSIVGSNIGLRSSGGAYAYLKTDSLGTDKTFNFPNTSGTFSLVGHTHSASDIIGLTIATPSLNDVLLVGATTSTAAEFRGGIYTNNGLIASGHFNIGDSLINGAFTYIDSLFKGDLSEDNTVFKINYKENSWSSYLDNTQDSGSSISLGEGRVQIIGFDDSISETGLVDVDKDQVKIVTTSLAYSSNIEVNDNNIALTSNEISFTNGTLGGNYLSISDSSDDVTISGNTGVKIKGLTGGLGLYSAVLKTHKLTNDRVFQFPNYSSELIGINTSNQLNLDIASMNIETSGDITFKSGNILTLGASIYFQLFNGTYNMILDMSSLTGDRQLNFTNANGLIPAFRSDLVPTSPTASGVVGEIRADNEYMYMCLDTNHWIRCATDGTWS